MVRMVRCVTGSKGGAYLGKRRENSGRAKKHRNEDKEHKRELKRRSGSCGS